MNVDLASEANWEILNAGWCRGRGENVVALKDWHACDEKSDQYPVFAASRMGIDTYMNPSSLETASKLLENSLDIDLEVGSGRCPHIG